jgi:8-oxo-dGTP diphosphatase
MENKLFLVSQKAFIFKDGRLLIIKNSKGRHGGISQWELPGGILEANEEINDGLAREIREETSLDIEIKNILVVWKKMTTVSELGGKEVPLLGIGYKCSWVSGEVILGDEHEEYLWVSKDQLKDFSFSHNSEVGVVAYLKSFHL